MNKKSGAEDVAASKAPSNQDTESDMIIVPSTVESKFTTQQLERAHRTISRAKAWTRENPSAWQRMNELALEDAGRGKRVSGSALVEDCRKKDFTDVYGKATRVNNDLFNYIQNRNSVTVIGNIYDNPELIGGEK